MATRQLSDLRKLQRNQLIKINKEDLIDSILASNAEDGELAKLNKRLDDVMNEVKLLRDMITSPESILNKNYTELKARVDKQAEIMVKQQQFLETLDRKERESNIVILGVPEEHETLEGATQDEEKIRKIWAEMGVGSVSGNHRRLGDSTSLGTRRRPILFALADKGLRSTILDNAKRLKTSGDNYNKIYVKKDVHPSVRREWRRLREAETIEKARPENAGCTVRLDTRERKLYRDADVIDSWNPQFF